ncbi:transglycosylase family protein [Streptomyces sp. H27-C3]|uniref:transglycosylase family protein n=1 Tax=Streptomyces sp. H27-C3 TaxID=3046305 RepID=UPI0024BB18DC|nr:transglycosylase family protein [Streptomyces sp. H27-C3]MDJ0460446.1 transglycosylase family protein [Streptomyces sp. H27-C3]
MLFSSKAKHRRPSKATRVAALAGISGAVIAAPLMGASSASAASVETWDAVAQCESGGNWSIDTGNGYSGGLQFSPSSWAAAGGTQYAPSAAQASKSQQIAAAERLLDLQGPGAWACAGAGGLTNDGVDPNVDTSGSQKQAEPQQEQEQQQEQQQAAPRAAEQPASRSEVRSAPKAESKPAAPIKKGDGEYKVKAGDTLGKIATAEKVKGGWDKVFELNKDIVTDADVIYPGQQLHLK